MFFVDRRKSSIVTRSIVIRCCLCSDLYAVFCVRLLGTSYVDTRLRFIILVYLFSLVISHKSDLYLFAHNCVV